MGEIETGHKWWIRYVVVPLLGGGGLIAVIVVAILGREATPVYKVPTPSKDEQTETVEVDAAAVGVVALDEFYVVDEHDKTFLTDARTRKGSVFTARWDARDLSSGQLHLLILGSDGKVLVNEKVNAMGMRKISSDYRIGLKLAEERNGKLRLIKALSVEVF